MRRVWWWLALGTVWAVAEAQIPAATWRFFGNPAPNNPALPGVGKQTIYYPCLNRLYAVNMEDGTLKWQYPADAPLNTTILGQPVEGEGLVYIGTSNGNVLALDAQTGSLRWVFTADSAPTARPLLRDGVLYIGTGRGEVYALNARSGEPVWREPYRADDYIAGQLVTDGETLFFGTNGGLVHAISLAGGRRRWVLRLPAPNYDSQPVLAGNTLFLTSSDSVIALNPASGAARWTRRFNTDFRLAPAADENYVVVLTRENRMFVFDHSGRIVAGDKEPIEVRYEPLVAPEIHAGKLWVATRRGTILCYSLPEGKLVWMYTLRPPEGTVDANNRRVAYLALTGKPVFIPNGFVVATGEGNLTAFQYGWVDRTMPQVVRTTPAIGELLSGQLPLDFFARIRDDGTGINPDSVQWLLNDEPLPAEYEPSLGELTVRLRAGTAAKPLPDGRHTMTIIASDWAGNTLRYTWAIYIDNSLRRAPARSQQQQPPRQPGGRGGGGGRGPDF
ncbi:MAG: PQQ-like beta-propeller repeat protein [Fimbriimonadales bacterium]|nr:PQQ-like beta-propeller repeat protein [Fimbriimonadales bacterium]MDW8052699.1 PQQ-binding-like beta-propeller repeat protein [Armatimonadota bacterium]